MTQQTLEYLYNLNTFGIKLGLEVISKILQELDNPHHKFKSIHIAGTNGKGSTAAFIASILREVGYKVGLYTSPHLIRFNERIKINENEITDEELVNYTKIIKQQAEKSNLQPTFFEFTTAMAFLHFAVEQVDYAVIETGLGGRLDATNVLNPQISVITNISRDHTEHLGNGKLNIAQEKASIIKENSLVVTAEQDEGVLKLFNEFCEEKKSKLLIVDEQLNGTEIKTHLLGEYQIKNAAMAYLVGNLLNIPESRIHQGLLKAEWPGRLEYIAPNVLIDCAHNVAGMKELSSFIKKLPQRKILILGISEDKEISKMVSLIAPLVDEIILTQGNYKPASLEVLEREVKNYTNNIKKCSQVEEAIKEALKQKNKDDLILVAGSIYLVGDVLKHKSLFRKVFK